MHVCAIPINIIDKKSSSHLLRHPSNQRENYVAVVYDSCFLKFYVLYHLVGLINASYTDISSALFNLYHCSIAAQKRIKIYSTNFGWTYLFIACWSRNWFIFLNGKSVAAMRIVNGTYCCSAMFVVSHFIELCCFSLQNYSVYLSQSSLCDFCTWSPEMCLDLERITVDTSVHGLLQSNWGLVAADSFVFTEWSSRR